MKKQDLVNEHLERAKVWAGEVFARALQAYHTFVQSKAKRQLLNEMIPIGEGISLGLFKTAKESCVRLENSATGVLANHIIDQNNLKQSIFVWVGQTLERWGSKITADEAMAKLMAGHSKVMTNSVSQYELDKFRYVCRTVDGTGEIRIQFCCTVEEAYHDGKIIVHYYSLDPEVKTRKLTRSETGRVDDKKLQVQVEPYTKMSCIEHPTSIECDHKK